MENIVIGKRVLFGQIVMSTVNLGVFAYNTINPEAPLPGEIVGMISQPIIGVGQIVLANRFGVTTK